MRCAAAIRSSSASRVESGSSSRSRPSTCSTSKNHGCSSVSRAASAPNRDIVSWNGRGAPSSSSESVSPSRITSCTGMRRTTSTTSGSRCVTSARLRVKTRTSSPARCTWMRAPSSLYSTDASPVVASAADALDAVAASIGSTGRPTTSPTASSSAAVPVSASLAVSPRSPESIAARRTTSPGRSAARAIASVSTPSSAPVRISPSRTRAMKSCSRSVARAVEFAELAAAVAGRAGTGCRGEPIEHRVEFADRERRRLGRLAHRGGHPAPADADAPLPSACPRGTRPPARSRRARAG